MKILCQLAFVPVLAIDLVGDTEGLIALFNFKGICVEITKLCHHCHFPRMFKPFNNTLRCLPLLFPLYR